MPENHDGALAFVLSKSRNMLVPYYLMASYGYYIRDVSLLSDGVFDQLCRDLDAEWDQIEHIHKGHVNRAALRAGTCFLKREDYPTRVKNAACAMLRIRFETADLPPALPAARVRTRRAVA